MTDNSEILFSEEFRRSVEENRARDPVRIALDRRVPHAAAVASQVKYLARAESKLPSYHAARCILPSLAFEQSSSEQAAARKNYSGRLAIDLTCGLGVDSFRLSKRFERVIAIERDPFLAAVAKENFRRLGADNVEVVNGSAEEFLSGLAGGSHYFEGLEGLDGSAGGFDGHADLVYADPDRRSAEGKKMIRLEDCSPDMVALLPLIERIAPRLVVKLSALFDVNEVFRVFGPGARVEVVSLNGECKEIIADITHGSRIGRTISAVAIGTGETEYTATDDPVTGDSREPDRPSIPQVFTPELYRRLVVPDVALQKARLVRRYFSERGVWSDSDNGYGFAVAPPEEGIMGRVIEIDSIEPFDPKALKRRLREQKIKSIDILKRNFPLRSADIARQLAVREGGTQKIAFTRAADRLWQIILKPEVK